MNPEETSTGQQETLERFPSQEEIRSAFETIVQGKEYTELRLLIDAEGVRVYDIEIVLEDGEKREYNYQRPKNDVQEQWLPAASIHVTTYDAEGMPYGGQCVANYRDGTWQYIPQTP